MSPEMLRNEAYSSKSDIYSLGVIAHELATGVRPAQGFAVIERWNHLSTRLRQFVLLLLAQVSRSLISPRSPSPACFLALCCSPSAVVSFPAGSGGASLRR
jgi:serine/threonine protein kinase